MKAKIGSTSSDTTHAWGIQASLSCVSAPQTSLVGLQGVMRGLRENGLLRLF